MLEGDIIEIYGEVTEVLTYEAIFGNQITIPKINALHIELKQKASGEIIPEKNNETTTPSIEINLSENQSFPYNQKVTIWYTVNGVDQNGEYDIHLYERLFYETGKQIWKDTYDIGKESGKKDGELLYSLSFTPTTEMYPPGEYTLEITVYDYLTNETITKSKKLKLE